jgi:hypothetical protein
VSLVASTGPIQQDQAEGNSLGDDAVAISASFYRMTCATGHQAAELMCRVGQEFNAASWQQEAPADTP